MNFNTKTSLIFLTLLSVISLVLLGNAASNLFVKNSDKGNFIPSESNIFDFKFVKSDSDKNAAHDHLPDYRSPMYLINDDLYQDQTGNLHFRSLREPLLDEVRSASVNGHILGVVFSPKLYRLRPEPGAVSKPLSLSDRVKAETWRHVHGTFYRDTLNLYCAYPTTSGAAVVLLQDINPDKAVYHIEQEAQKTLRIMGSNIETADKTVLQNLGPASISDGKITVNYRCAIE